MFCELRSCFTNCVLLLRRNIFKVARPPMYVLYINLLHEHWHANEHVHVHVKSNVDQYEHIQNFWLNENISLWLKVFCLTVNVETSLDVRKCFVLIYVQSSETKPKDFCVIWKHLARTKTFCLEYKHLWTKQMFCFDMQTLETKLKGFLWRAGYIPTDRLASWVYSTTCVQYLYVYRLLFIRP